MLTMFNDAKNFPEYRLFIFIKVCICLAVYDQPEYLFLSDWFSYIFQNDPEDHIIGLICSGSVSFLRYTLVILIYEFEAAEIIIQSMNPQITMLNVKSV